MKQKIEILYEDEDVIGVNKPPFVLTIPDRYAPQKLNLLTYLSKNRKDVYTVHRIDKETSGIILFAKNKEVHRALSQQFQDRTIEKYYWTILDGVVHQDTGEIDSPIAAHPSEQGKMMVHKRGKPSQTQYKVLQRFRHFTLVEAAIKTGRTHQIRVHFESIGYPLAVDSVYGRRDAFLLSEVKGKKYHLGRDQTERPLLKRSALHARRITFVHPTRQSPMTLEAELPKDFAAVLKQLQKWGG